MPGKATGRLVILSGPSCAGKTPMVQAMERLFPDVYRRLRPIVIYNDREPRPGERDGVDYHFRERDAIEAMRGNDRYAVAQVRNDLHGVDLEELRGLLAEGDPFFEGSPTVARLLQTHPALAEVPRLSLFVSPLNREDLDCLVEQPDVEPAEVVAKLMRGKLVRRHRKQKGEPSEMALEDIQTRAACAYEELKLARHFDHVIPNHDGEDSDHWDLCPHPLGDARQALYVLVALLEGRGSPWVEAWPVDLLP